MFEWREALESLQALCEVISCNEGLEVVCQLCMRVVVIALHGGVFQRPVHALDLAVRPRMIDLGEAVFDIIFATDAVKDVLAGVFIA